jgi:hypothetical protein
MQLATAMSKSRSRIRPVRTRNRLKKSAAAPSTTPLTPERILQLGTGFFASRAVLSAAELGVFTELDAGPLDGETLRARLQLHPRGARDFFDALVALGLLKREHGLYSNTAEAAQFLVRGKPGYMGGILEMCGTRLYGYWDMLNEALSTGQPQNEMRNGGEPFGEIYATQEKLESFLNGMTGISLASARSIAQKFPWKYYKTFADVGAAQGAVPAQVALAHPHLRGVGFDLPVVQHVFEKYIQGQGLSDRVRFQSGNFFKESLPSVDVIIMGHILHDWDLDQKQVLIRKAFQALPPGGSFIVYEALIDDDRSKNAFGLLMSLNMLIETVGGFDYTGADCQQWMRNAGFRETRVEHLEGPHSMVIAVK